MGYTPLRINTIKPAKSITFDLYIFFKEQYVCYKKNGISLPQDLLSKLRKQRVARFFISDQDENMYQKYLDEILEGLAENDDIPVEEKANITEGATSRAIEKMQKNPANKASFKLAENAIANLRKIIDKHPEALKQIFDNETSGSGSDLVIKHSLNVAMLSTKLAQKMKIREEKIDNIAIAALLHDIGVMQLPPDKRSLFIKPRKAMTPEEIKIYNSHSKLATDKLKDKPYINKEILDLMFNYGENLTGTGPNKKKKLVPEVEALSLVNCYDKKILCEKLKPQEALKQFQVSEMGSYNLESIKLFKTVLKEQKIV